MSDKKSIVDRDLIKELAELLTETGLTEIEVEHDDRRIRVARNAGPAVIHAPVAAPAPVAAVASAPGGDRPKDDHAAHPGTLHSPMVGTAYRASEPGGKPYVDIGDKVREGQTVLIVEAMKTMNQIPASRSGTVIAVMVEDGQPVEYGEPLMIIE
jgi:acetyl-CoA carboxylase biotin carboxyl carrier protein